MLANDTYKLMQTKSKAVGEKNDCTVKAAALLAGVEYEEAHRLFKRAGRRTGRGFSLWQAMDIMRSLGCHVGPPLTPPARTVRTLERAMPGGMYLVTTYQHCFAVINGEILDWTRGRLHRIQNMYKVTR